MTLHWRGSHPAYFAVTRNGGKYTINRWGTEWVINYLPTGTPDGGFERVAWVGNKRTADTAKASCEAHAQPCEECNAEAGEPCRPYCIGKATADEAGE